MGVYWCELCGGDGLRYRWQWRWPFIVSSRCTHCDGKRYEPPPWGPRPAPPPPPPPRKKTN